MGRLFILLAALPAVVHAEFSNDEACAEVFVTVSAVKVAMIQAIADGRWAQAAQFEQHYLVANRAASFCLEAGLPSREKLKEVEARKRRASTNGADGVDGAGRAEQSDDLNP